MRVSEANLAMKTRQTTSLQLQRAATFKLPEPVAAETVARIANAGETQRKTAAERRRQTLGQAKSMLSALEALKVALLEGRIGPALANLAGAGQGDLNSGDPVLDDLAAHIRLRADVELAKARQREAGATRKSG